MSQKKENSTSNAEWANRILCSDESCIGVIGPDGRCKECGKAYAGVLPVGFSRQDANQTADAGDEALEAAAKSLEQETASLSGDLEDEGVAVNDDEWSRRKLCSDENCIGVIGPDGRCKECGKPG